MARRRVRLQPPRPVPAARGSPGPTDPHRKLRRNVPRVEGALTTQPSAPAVPPVRNTFNAVAATVIARVGVPGIAQRPCKANVAGRISPA